MADIKLGNRVYEGVTEVKMDTPTGGTVSFPKYVTGTPLIQVLEVANWNGSRYTLEIDGY